MIFKEGEIYEMEKINDNWNIIEAIGIPPGSISAHFEVQ